MPALQYAPCFKDLCMVDVMYCVEERQKCYKCEDRSDQCGTAEMPWQCYSYCQELEFDEFKTNMGMNSTSESWNVYRQAFITSSICAVFLLLLAICLAVALWRLRRRLGRNVFNGAKLCWNLGPMPEDTSENTPLQETMSPALPETPLPQGEEETQPAPTVPWRPVVHDKSTNTEHPNPPCPPQDANPTPQPPQTPSSPTGGCHDVSGLPNKLKTLHPQSEEHGQPPVVLCSNQ